MAQSSQVKAATGKSKVVKSSTPKGFGGGKGKMAGKQSVKPAKKA